MKKVDRPDNYAIEINGIKKKYGRKTVLNDLSLQILPGTIVNLVGLSGSGKTTLAKLLLGFERPTRGQILINGKPVSGSDPSWKFGAGFVSSLIKLPGHLRVGQLLSMIAHYYGDADYSHAEPLCKMMGVDIDAKISRLAPGDLQKLRAVAALIDDPDVLILDRPFDGLDYAAKEKLVRVIMNNRDRNKTALIIDSQLNETVEKADQVVFLRDGKISGRVQPRKLSAKAGKIVRMVGQTRGLKLLEPPEHFAANIIKHDGSELVFLVKSVDSKLLRWMAMQPLANIEIKETDVREAIVKKSVK